MEAIFPDLIHQNREELKNNTGLVCNIDTSDLQQAFLIGRENSEEDEDETE